jgi:hypothetical protein
MIQSVCKVVVLLNWLWVTPRISRCGYNALGMIMSGIKTPMANLKSASGWVLRMALRAAIACFWLLPMSARPIARSTVWNMTIDELAGAALKEALDSSIDSKIGVCLNKPTIDLDGGNDVDNGYCDDADYDKLAERKVWCSEC